MTKKSRPRAKGKARSGTWSLLQNKLFTLFIVLLPVQLGLHFWPDWALVSGIRVDYLAPVIYLTDLIVIALLVVSFKDIKKINLSWIIAITIFALVNIYFANVSQIAWISLILAIILFKFRKIVFGLIIFVSILFPVVSKILLTKFNFGQSVAQRLELAYLAGLVFSKVALIGVGAGNFVTELPKLIYANNFNWLLQPV